jgi:hypothetical protein
MEFKGYPTLCVRNCWVDFSKESMSKYFELSKEGLRAAVEYCKAHKLPGVVRLDSETHVETRWDNPNF